MNKFNETQSPEQVGINLKALNEKFDIILAKIPILEYRTEEIDKLKLVLEFETKKRKHNEEKYLKCIGKLENEVAGLKQKMSVLKEKIENAEKVKEISDSEPETEPTKSSYSVSVSGSSSSLQSNEEIKVKKDCLIKFPKEIQIKLDKIDFGQFKQTRSIELPNDNNDKKDKIKDNKKSPITITKPTTPKNVTKLKTRSSLNQARLQLPIEPIITKTDSDQKENNGISYKPSKHEVNELSEIAIANIHGQAPETGRYLPFMCLCKQEFDTELLLSEHINQECSEMNATDMKSELLEPSEKKKKSTLTKKRNEKGPGFGSGSAQIHGFHKRVQHKSGKFIYFCKCGKKYASLHHVDRHIGTLRGANLKCPKCPQKYTTIHQLRQHLKKAHGMNYYLKDNQACSLCGEMFKDRKSLLEHRRKVHYKNLNLGKSKQNN